MRDYLQLCKPRIAVMVAATAWIGFLLAGGRAGASMAWMLIGTTLTACASGALNQWFEQDLDALMLRTRRRPLPSGRLSSLKALAFGLALGAAGLGLLLLRVHALACLLAALTMAFYLLLYTPLKTRTPQSTWLGAVAGAAPPLIGWAAARGSLGLGAWALFAIQLLWQIPHFLALFWMHREDYARAGFKVMPVVDPGGASTALQIALHSFAVLLASLFPSLCGMAGAPYGLGALVLGSGFLVLGMKASWTLALIDTRRLFLASLAYLPILFGMLVLGGV